MTIPTTEIKSPESVQEDLARNFGAANAYIDALEDFCGKDHYPIPVVKKLRQALNSIEFSARLIQNDESTDAVALDLDEPGAIAKKVASSISFDSKLVDKQKYGGINHSMANQIIDTARDDSPVMLPDDINLATAEFCLSQEGCQNGLRRQNVMNALKNKIDEFNGKFKLSGTEA